MSVPVLIGRGVAKRVWGGVLISLALGLGLLGLLAIGVAAYATWENSAFRRQSVEARGRVVEIVRHDTGRTDSARYRHLPVVEFTTAEGHRNSFTSDFAGNPRLEVGDEVSVLYTPERPSNARLAAAWPAWGSKSVTGPSLAVEWRWP